MEEFARELPYLSLVAVRIEIERALRLLMTFRGLKPERDLGINRTLRELRESGEVPSGTDAFLQTLATMNEAVHGFEVEPAVAAEALRVASEFLGELRRLAAESWRSFFSGIPKKRGGSHPAPWRQGGEGKGLSGASLLRDYS